jgi:predicted phage terminase large subunit-like protein
VNLHDVPSDVRVDRALGLRGSFHDFVQMAWPLVEHARPFVDNWHIRAICEHLEAVFEGRIKRLVINIPPGCMKSLTCSVFWPVWCWLRNPSWRFIYGSFDKDLVGKRDGSKVLEIITSKWFRERFGDKVMIRGKEPAFGDFETTARGFRFATSVGGKLMGRHAHALVIDDPIKPQELTDIALKDAEEWRKSTVSSRLLPGGAVVLMMQRLHENDLAGIADAEGGWDFLRLPMRYETELHCATSIGFEDPRKGQEGALLWPDYKDEGEVSQIEKDMGGRAGTTVAAQLQQRPAPARGIIFNKETFEYWTRASLPAEFDFVVDSWDCTFKGTDSSDYVVGQKWGMKAAKFYLLAIRRGRWSFTQTLAEVEALRTDATLPKAHAVLVEDKANGTAVIDVLGQKVPGFVPVNPEGGKIVRANAVTPLFEARNVYHPHPDIHPWIAAHETELLKFPKGKNDDSVDCATQALNYLRSKASHFGAAMDQFMKDGASWLLH